MKKRRKSPKLMKISQAARAAGVSTQTIEYYILVGLIAPVRSPSGRRFFGPGHVGRIRLIRNLNKSGYTLRSIRETYMQRK